MKTNTQTIAKPTFSERNQMFNAFGWISLLSAAAVNAPIASQRLTSPPTAV